MERADLAIVGGGIVGLATAYKFQQRFPGRRVVVLEKEREPGAHQTGHNSGVLHTGIYYKPGSLKAANCQRGKRWMQDYCSEREIPFELCGKVIVAVSESDLPALKRIHERGQANGVVCEWIGPERLAELEPHAAGVQAIHVPEAGIVDYSVVCRKLSEDITGAGGEVLLGARVTGLSREASGCRVESRAGALFAERVVNCAGLHSDRVTEMSGARRPARIVPFRGEYYELEPDARHLCRGLIYPTPDPSFPFLGVHFTRMIGGGVECGPNAVLALAREGYSWGKINPRDLFDTLSYVGFWRIALRYWRTGSGEVWRSLSKRAFVKALKRLVPEIEARQLVRAPAGVRAQALTRKGALVDDFLIEVHGPLIHVCNAPSPAATSALSIGATIVDRLAQPVPA